jgi:glycosyltransferase involved in cell wall biosynthesis
MNLVFAYDVPFYRDSAGQYYSLPAWSALWGRYLSVFDSVVMATRIREMPAGGLKGVYPSQEPRVSFLAIPSLSSPGAQIARRGEASRRLGTALQSADALIARLPSEIGACAIQAAKRMRKPWAVEVAGCPWDSLRADGRWQGKLYAPYATLRMKALIRRAPYALYVTQAFLQRRYPCAGKTASCSNAEIPAPDDQTLARRLAALHGRGTALRIGMIGDLNIRYKGLSTALTALGSARARMPPLAFHILGDGDPEPWRRIAEKAGVAEQTVFCGTLPAGNAVHAWLDAVDLYVQPSLTEGLPRALIEAMSRGCPSLGSTAGGIPELLDADCLHPPGDHRRLAERLARAATDRSWQQAQACRNFEVGRRYSKPVLDAIRTTFWQQFAEEARSTQNLR